MIRFDFLVGVTIILLLFGLVPYLWQCSGSFKALQRRLLEALQRWANRPRQFRESACGATLFYLVTSLDLFRVLHLPIPWLRSMVFVLSLVALTFLPYWSCYPRPALQEPWRLVWAPWRSPFHLTLHLLLAVAMMGSVMHWRLPLATQFVSGLIAVGYLTSLLTAALPALETDRRAILAWLLWFYIRSTLPSSSPFLTVWLVGLMIAGPVLMALIGRRIVQTATAGSYTLRHLVLLIVTWVTCLLLTYDALSLSQLILRPNVAGYAAFEPTLLLRSLYSPSVTDQMKSAGTGIPLILLLCWVGLTLYFGRYFCKWSLDSFMNTSRSNRAAP